MSAVIAPEILDAIEQCYKDPDIRQRSYYPEFRRGWDAVFERVRRNNDAYFNIDSPRCYSVENDFAGLKFTFHIDQLKIAEWYQKEAPKRKKVVFFGKKLKRDRKTGLMMFHEAVCTYNPDAPEAALTEELRNIIACALPRIPLSMEVVYGNKWVNSRFTPLRRNSLDLFFIGTDYVPAFLGSPLEVAVYLFLMDYCIIKINLGKAKDEDIRNLLHIIRPSPMLRIKGLA